MKYVIKSLFRLGAPTGRHAVGYSTGRRGDLRLTISLYDLSGFVGLWLRYERSPNRQILRGFREQGK